MNRILLVVCCLLLSWNANALEVAGVKLPDSVSLSNQNLLRNGAGIRTKWFFKVYVAALYLPKKLTSDSEIIADENPQRIALHMLRDLGEKKFLHAFIEAIEANHTKVEMAMLDDQIKQMTDIFHLVQDVKSGDVIDLDYLPGIGTLISLNGVTYGTIAGEMFHRAILKIWLGKNPVQDDLKKGMLGG
jgi:Chalcone isomerase-like